MEKDKSFMESFMAGDASIDDLSDYIEFWHTHKTGISLREFLGITKDEYDRWAKSDDAIFYEFLRYRQIKLV
jgi:hypothetical protein